MMAGIQISLAEELRRIASGADILGDPSGELAYFYGRSSDKMQATEGRESLSRQLLFAHEKAIGDGRCIPADMAYWDVWQGKDAERPEFHRLLTDVTEKKRSDTIYIDQTDRLSRNTAVYYVLIYDLTRYGLNARFQSDEDNLIRHIKLVFDEIELERRRYRQIQANRARATKGNVISKYAAYGYDFSDDRLSYVINEEQASWIRQIFDWYTSGKSVKAIAKMLNELGLLSPRGKQVWHPEVLRGILRKELYKGVYVANREEKVWVWEGGKQKKVSQQKPKDEWIYLSVPAIVSEAQWDEAQRRLETGKEKSLRNANKHEWLLSGLVKCVCGYTCRCRRKKDRRRLLSEDKTYVYESYMCSNHGETWRPERCDRGAISKDKLEAYVLEAISSLLTNPELWEQALDEQSDLMARWAGHIELCKKQIEEVDAQLGELVDLVLQQRSAKMRQMFAAKQEELEKQREQFEEQLAAAEARMRLAEEQIDRRARIDEVIERLKKVGLASLPFDAQRQVITQLVDTVVVDTSKGWFELQGVLGSQKFLPSEENFVTESATRPYLGHAKSPRTALPHPRECCGSP